MAIGISQDRRNKRLKSWKEIAAFFGTDERTARRWEERGLPVHRVPGGARPTVYADIEELEAWFAGRNAGAASAAPPGPASRRPALLLAGLAGLAAAGVATATVLGTPPFSRAERVRHQPPPKAVDLYLAGTYNWERRTPEGLHRALDLFGRAIAEDPAYAEAYVGLANAYLLLREYSGMPDREAYPRARDAAQRALALDEQLPNAHAALAFVTFYWDGDWERGLRSFERAIALDPRSGRAHHWYATALYHTGRIHRALAAINEGQRRDPTSRSILADKGLILFHAGRRDEAVTLLRQLAASEPDFKSPHAYLAIIFLAGGEDAAYLREEAIAARLTGDPDRIAVADAAAEGFRRGGRRGMFDAILAERIRMLRAGRGSDYEVAAAYSRLGRGQAALRHLAAAVSANETEVASVRMDPRFRPLHGEPAFRRLAARVGSAASRG